MKLKKVREKLQVWCKKNDLSNPARANKEAKENLIQIQNLLQMDPLNPDLIRQEKEAMVNHIDLSKREEDSVRLKERTIWLQSGDQTPSFSTQCTRAE